MHITKENRQAVDNLVFSLMKKVKAMRDGLGLNADGINWLGDAAVADFDKVGKIDLERVLELADEARGYAAFREDYPHPGDKQLDWLRSVEDIREASVEKMRRYSQPVAKGEMTRDDSGKTLNERFNERVLWLGQNNVHRAEKEEVPQQSARPLTAKEQAAAKLKTEIDAVKVEIDAATKGYTNWAIRHREKLHARFAELLADMPRAKFFDRYGSQEWLTGWRAVQRLIREEIHTVENGSIR